MLGVVLIYVGVVLILNGVGRLCNVDAKSSAVFNVFTGMLSFILNIVAVIQGNYFAAEQDYYLDLHIYILQQEAYLI